MKARGMSKNQPSSVATEIERQGGFSDEPGGFEVVVECRWGGVFNQILRP
jgi:hypothetical protein